ncbi:alpha/beta fold hydrolase [Halobacillus yeomjeoni]|uniref:Alpha/beta hydrolase n=1 Tax=Halobacillus yeomjeoni TaxID=311194 RepID=A0A931HSS0_9BACI|nr:alpha/beta hydrolase [Halobacillus yeomjeoni]MBH0229112.1 alpha/beta hydrolase [Halobacillus yeomjeoni]
MKRYFINDGQLDVHITEWGREQAPVIFCLHGLGSTSLSFIEIAEELKNEYRIISVDAPGHGKTGTYESQEMYDTPALSSWLNTILYKLGIEEFYFLAHSWGGFVALYYLLHNSEKVKGTILIDGGYQTKWRMDKTVDEETAHYEKDFEGCVETWDEFLDTAVYGNSRRTRLLDIAAKDLSLEKNGKYYWHARGTTAAKIIRGMHKYETEDIYEQLPSDMDLLLLRPQSDLPYRNLTAGIFQEKTGALVKCIPHTSHMLHWDNPAVVIEEIRERWK